MCPCGPSTSSSTKFARLSQTFRTVVVPAYSTQVVEPLNGRTRRLRRVSQEPNSKSKSCCPSRGAGAPVATGAGSPLFDAAKVGGKITSPNKTRQAPGQPFMEPLTVEIEEPNNACAIAFPSSAPGASPVRMAAGRVTDRMPGPNQIKHAGLVLRTYGLTRGGVA